MVPLVYPLVPTDPENPVRIGAMDFRTTASDRDRYIREKYNPESPANL